MAASSDQAKMDQYDLSVWYCNFESLTIKTMFICLHQDFIDYLLSDGIVLPEGLVT
jgi:hypothetical protein